MPDKASLENLSPEERDNLAALAQKLSTDPSTRQLFLRLSKKADPSLVIPEVDVLDTVAAAVKPHIDKIAAMEAKELEREVKERIRVRRDELRDKGYTKDEIDSIEKLMVDKQIPNHATAAEFFSVQRQTATPTPANYTMPRVPIPTKDQIKEAGGMKRHFIGDAHKAIDDIRAGRVKLH